jgi:hypothetical protein
VNFYGYADLYGTVQDFMKLCAVALLTEEDAVSFTLERPCINLAKVMELALQLMPANVPEFLDGMKTILDEENNLNMKLLEFNYSTMRIIGLVLLIILAKFGKKN